MRLIQTEMLDWVSVGIGGNALIIHLYATICISTAELIKLRL